MDLLSRMQLRRSRGTPTVVLLVGPVGLGIERWRQWCDEQGLAVARTEQAADIDRCWVLAASERCDLRKAAANAISRAARIGLDEILTATVPDLDLLWRRLPPALSDTRTARLCRALLRTPDRSLASAEGLAPEETIGALSEILERRNRPALLVVEPRQRGGGWLQSVLAALSARTDRCSDLAVAVCVSGVAYAEWLTSAQPDSRWVTLAREGFVPVDGLAVAALNTRLSAIVPPPDPTSIQRLADDGVDEMLADRYAAAASAVRERPLDVSRARSAAEQFLFDRLQSLPETAGRFVLNAELPFRHGPALAEADLLSRADRFVIEVDGAHFHLTPEQYRRDRRKDWLLQQHGYRVLRVLAEDVVDRLSEILDTVGDALALRAP